MFPDWRKDLNDTEAAGPCVICGGDHDQLDCDGRGGIGMEPGWEPAWPSDKE